MLAVADSASFRGKTVAAKIDSLLYNRGGEPAARVNL